MSERKQLIQFLPKNDNSLWRSVVAKVLVSLVALVVVTVIKSHAPDDGVNKRLDKIEQELNRSYVVQQQNNTVSNNKEANANNPTDVAGAASIGAVAGIILAILLF